MRSGRRALFPQAGPLRAAPIEKLARRLERELAAAGIAPPSGGSASGGGAAPKGGWPAEKARGRAAVEKTAARMCDGGHS